MNEDLKKQLLDLGLTEDQIEKLAAEGVETPSDMQLLSEQDIKEKTGAGLIAVKKLIVNFAPKVTPSTSMSFDVTGILPDVPSDESWLMALRAGGILKVEQSTVISAIRAALADKVGLYLLPSKLLIRMERFADDNVESAPKEYFLMRKLITKHNYAEIFEAIDGLDGTFVTETRKKSFLAKVDELLWPEVISFYEQLKNWIEAYAQTQNSPNAITGAIAVALNSFANGGKMSGGVITPVPDAGVLRDAADSLNDSINRVFAGVGVQIAAALAFDASGIKKILANDQLPSLVGAANRDQMLRMLEADVPATYPRLETNLTKFVLSVLKVKDIATDDEFQYFNLLYMLGSQIPWEKLSKKGAASLGGKRQL